MMEVERRSREREGRNRGQDEQTLDIRRGTESLREKKVGSVVVYSLFGDQ